MKCLTKKGGFTLVELMIVIAIIGLLSVALTTQVTKIQASARAAKCKANLRALAQVASNYGGDRFPAAGSFEAQSSTDKNAGTEDNPNYKPVWYVKRGWVTWTSGGGPAWAWGKDNKLGENESWDSHWSKYAQSPATCYGNAAYISITNGVFWPLLGKDIRAFVCDAHKSLTKNVFGKEIYRSYIMNGYFMYDEGSVGVGTDERETIEALVDGRAAIRLMFAELPAHGARNEEQFTYSALKYDGLEDKDDEDGYTNGKSFAIGFNHMVAKRWVAHVAFADGHVEGLVLPNTAKDKDGCPNYSDKDIRNLTGLLCNGREITGGLREKMR